MLTRASSNRGLPANINNGVVKRQQPHKNVVKSRAPSQRVRARGRKPVHDSRALMAIGVKLAMPGMELEPAVNMVNHVCNNPVNAEYPGASEEDLNVRTLRKRVVALMSGAPWKSMGPHYEEQWEAQVNEGIKELVFEICSRIKHDEDYAKLKNTTVVRQSGQAAAVEVKLDTNFGYKMVFPDHWVHLDPQEPEQQQLQQEPVQQQLQQQPEQQVQLPGGGGGGGGVPQLDSFSGFDVFDAEIDFSTFEMIDDDIDFDWLRGLNLE